MATAQYITVIIRSDLSSIHMCVPTTDLIRKIHPVVWIEWHFKSSEYSLQHNTKPLRDHFCFSDFGIGNGATLALRVRGRGGMDEGSPVLLKTPTSLTLAVEAEAVTPCIQSTTAAPVGQLSYSIEANDDTTPAAASIDLLPLLWQATAMTNNLL